MTAVAEAIRLIRTTRGKTQAEFAKGIGVSQNTISQYESGKLFPSRSILILLLQLAEVEPHKRPILRALGMKFLSEQSKIRDYLLQIMDDADLDRNDLVEALDISLTELEAIESGTPPHPDVIEKLKSVAVRAGRPDLAIQLGSGKWKVGAVFHPGEVFITRSRKRTEANRPSLTDLAKQSGVGADDPLMEILRLWDAHGTAKAGEAFQKAAAYLEIELARAGSSRRPRRAKN